VVFVVFVTGLGELEGLTFSAPLGGLDADRSDMMRQMVAETGNRDHGMYDIIVAWEIAASSYKQWQKRQMRYFEVGQVQRANLGECSRRVQLFYCKICRFRSPIDWSVLKSLVGRWADFYQVPSMERHLPLNYRHKVKF